MKRNVALKTFAPFFVFVFSLFWGFSSVYADHAWSKYHWPLSTEESTSNPLELGDNLTTTDWYDSLFLASDEWNKSVLQNTIGVGASNNSCDPTSGRVEVCNDEYGDNGWLGIASIWVKRGKTGHITQGVVMLNDTYFNTPTYNTVPWRNLVMCQEVGHTFGLGHQDENFTNVNLGTCMDYTDDPDGTIVGQLDNQYPNQHDYDMLATIYDHHNSTTDDGSGNGNGNGKGGGRGKPHIDPNDPSSWGQAVKQDALGNNIVFERNLGNGHFIITHVTWVVEHHH